MNNFSTNAHAVWAPQWQQVLSEAPWKEWIADDNFFDCRDKFLREMHLWIIRNKFNTIEVSSLARFKRRDSIIGTTQALDEFHWRHRDKTLRMFRGEYAYNRRVYETHDVFIPQDHHLDTSSGDYRPLTNNDYVIISLPFAGFGDKHYHMDTMLNDALKTKTPVLVDCAWFGTCMNIDFDFSHPAITEVCFSTSKGLGCGRYRSGIRYSNYEDGMIYQHNNYNHLVGSNMQLAMWMMQHFRSDHIPANFRGFQEDICKEFGLTPANCIHIGIAPKTAEWQEFELAGLHYRVGLNKMVKLRRQNKA